MAAMARKWFRAALFLHAFQVRMMMEPVVDWFLIKQLELIEGQFLQTADVARMIAEEEAKKRLVEIVVDNTYGMWNNPAYALC